MKTFEVHFIWHGMAYQETITTTNTYRVKQLIKGRYAGAKITPVQDDTRILGRACVLVQRELDKTVL